MRAHDKNTKYWKALKAAFPHIIPIFAGFWFLAVSGREANAEIYPVSGKGFAFSSIWAVGCLLSEKCEYFYWQPWYPGIAGGYPCGCASPVEKTNAPVYCRRNSMLYAAGTVYFLVILDNYF